MNTPTPSPLVVFGTDIDNDSQVDNLMDTLDPDVFLNAVDFYCEQHTCFVGGREIYFQ